MKPAEQRSGRRRVKILWVSRHPPLLKQMEELRRIFGDVEIVQYAGFVKDADHVVQLKEQYGADEVITILPMTMIYHLVKETGIKPIYPEVEPVPKNSKTFDFEDPKSKRKYVFKGFVRIIDFEIKKVPLR